MLVLDSSGILLGLEFNDLLQIDLELDNFLMIGLLEAFGTSDIYSFWALAPILMKLYQLSNRRYEC